MKYAGEGMLAIPRLRGMDARGFPPSCAVGWVIGIVASFPFLLDGSD